MTDSLQAGFAEEDATECVALVERMGTEVRAAYAALAAYQLADFRDRITSLEGLFLRWGWLSARSQTANTAATPTPVAHESCNYRLFAAHRRLAEHSYRLNALLRRCRRTVDLLLRHDPPNSYPACAGAALSHVHTWSSEV
jgi:hypothetical protein